MIGIIDNDRPTAPGFYRMRPEVYHADPCPAPSLSSGVLNTLLSSTPLHAWSRHPRLNPEHAETESERRMHLGSVAHRLVLGAGAEIDRLEYDSYRSKAAQEERAASIDAGRIPCLAADYERAYALAVPLSEAVDAYLGMPISQCLREVVAVWREGAHWRRIMIDVMTPDGRRLCDLKTTAASVAPEDCTRRLYEGYHVQAAFYTRGMDALDPSGMGRRSFGFLFAETIAPYAISPPIELSGAGRELAAQMVGAGCKRWDACLTAGDWPGYARDTYDAEPPPWVMNRAAERFAITDSNWH